MNEKELIDRLAYLLLKKMEKQLEYITFRKKCIVQMKEMGLLPKDYKEIYTVGGYEIT